MTSKQSKNLITQVAQEYLGEHWNKKLSSIQFQIWEEVLVEWDFDFTKSAIRQMFIDKPAYKFKEIFRYSMPDVDILEIYYNVEIAANKKYCPCCDGTGWAYYDPDSVRRCEHGTPTSEEVCNNFHCQPRKDFPCPLGTQYYSVKKIEFMKRIKKDPSYQLGLTFLKQDGEIAEIMAQQIEDVPEPDLPGEDSETLPF